MVVRRPLVSISGTSSELPDGDTLAGAVGGTLTTLSGVEGGGSLQDDGSAIYLSVPLAASPSGLVRDGDSIGMDGASFVKANDAIVSGIDALSTANTAISSGLDASSLAAVALASGNAALDSFGDVSYGTTETFTAATTIPSGYSVGMDDSNTVQVVRAVEDSNIVDPQTLYFQSSAGQYSDQEIAWNTNKDRFLLIYSASSVSYYGYVVAGKVDPDTKAITFGTATAFQTSSTFFVNVVYDDSDSRFVIFYRSNNTSLYANTVTLSGTDDLTINLGTNLNVGSASNSVSTISCSYDTVQQRTLVGWSGDLSRRFHFKSVASSSGTLSASTQTDLPYTGSQIYLGQWRSAYGNGSHLVMRSSDNLDAVAITISGANAPTAGTVTGMTANFCSSSPGASVTYNATQNRFMYIGYDQGISPVRVFFRSCQVSGTTISSVSTSTYIANTDNYTQIPWLGYNPTLERIYAYIGIGTQMEYRVFTLSSSIWTEVGTTLLAPEVGNAGYSSFVHADNPDVVIQNIGGLASSSNPDAIYARVLNIGANSLPKKSGESNFLGTALNSVTTGQPVEVRLPGSITDISSQTLASGEFYYLDPLASGFTTTSSKPSYWTGTKTWATVGIALNESQILITDTM
jgi:hypothetical protein